MVLTLDRWNCLLARALLKVLSDGQAGAHVQRGGGMFRVCGCSASHECWCSVRRRGGVCGKCSECRRNDERERRTGIPGQLACAVAKADVDDVLIAERMSVQYRLNALAVLKPVMLLADAPLRELYFLRLAMPSIEALEQSKLAAAEALCARVETLSMQCCDVVAGDGYIWTDIVHAGATQQFDAATLSTMLPPMLLERQREVQWQRVCLRAAHAAYRRCVARVVLWMREQRLQRQRAGDALMALRRTRCAIAIQRQLRAWWRRVVLQHRVTRSRARATILRFAVYCYQRACRKRLARQFRAWQRLRRVSATKIQALCRGVLCRSSLASWFSDKRVRGAACCVCSLAVECAPYCPCVCDVV